MLRRYVFGEELLNEEVVCDYKCQEGKEYVYKSWPDWQKEEVKHTKDCAFCQVEPTGLVFSCGKYWREKQPDLNPVWMLTEIDMHESCCHMCQSIRYLNYFASIEGGKLPDDMKYPVTKELMQTRLLKRLHFVPLMKKK